MCVRAFRHFVPIHKMSKAVYFLHCPKSNKKSSDPKNSLLHPIIRIVFRLAFTLFCEPLFYFFQLLLGIRDLFLPEIGISEAQTVLAHRFHYRK